MEMGAREEGCGYSGGMGGRLPRVPGIYQITCTSNLVIYIGSATNLYRRWATHRHDLRHGRHANARLQHSWNKYGPDAFVYDVLLTCDRNDLVAREQEALDGMSDLVGWDGMFNVLRTAHSSIGFRHTEESRRRMAEFHASRGPMASETKLKIGDAHRGMTRPDETRRRISEALKRSETISSSMASVWAGRDESEREAIKAKQRKPKKPHTVVRMREAQNRPERLESAKKQTSSWWASLSHNERAAFLERRGERTAEANRARTPEQRAAQVAKYKETVARRRAAQENQ